MSEEEDEEILPIEDQIFRNIDNEFEEDINFNDPKRDKKQISI